MRDSARYLHSRRDPDKKPITHRAIDAAEIAVGGGIVGWLAGRMGTTNLTANSSIPTGLVMAVAGHALGVFGPQALSSHAHNVANGFLAGWSAMWGAGQGGVAREKALGAAGPGVIATAGALPQHQAPQYPQRPPMQMGAGGVRYSPYGMPRPQAGHVGPIPSNQYGPYAGRSRLTEAELQGLAQQR